MAKRKIGKIREVKIDLASYSYLMNGIAGVGKTTTVCEIGQKEYGVDGFLLLTVGQEPEPEHIGNLWNERATDWDDLEEIIDTLCDDKSTEYKNLRMIGIDSIDEVFRLAEAKVIEMYNNKCVKVADRTETIKKCFGGFQAGENKVVDIVTTTLFKLRDCGVSLFFIGHTKQKNKKDLMTDIEFEQITSSIDSKYYNCIKDKVNIVMCAYMEREMADLATVKDAFSKKEKQTGRIASETRVISFRDEEYALDVKSHLKYIVPKCLLDSDVIIKELKDAMKKQSDSFHGEKTEEEFIEIKEKQVKEQAIKETLNKDKEDSIEVKQEKLDNIKANLSKLDFSKVQAIMKEYKLTSFENVNQISTECLNKITSLI